MNREFVERAEKLTSFNITTKDLQSLDFKKEVRHLFNKHFFPGVDLSGTVTVDKDSINNVVSQLKACDIENFRLLHNYNLKGVGPGEMTLYCAVDSAVLGGGSSAGVDVKASCGDYEVKAVSVSNDRVASNFKLGGTVSLHDLMIDLDSLRKRLHIDCKGTEIPKLAIQSMRERAPDEFNEIEAAFAKATADYFGDHKTIFINHSPNPSKLGTVEAITTVTADIVSIERVTSGTIKPAVRL